MSEQPRRRRRQARCEEPIVSAENPNEAVAPKTEAIAPSKPYSNSYAEPMYDVRTGTGLLEYIKTAIELETDLATQEQIISKCKEDIQRRKPELKLKQAPCKPQMVDEPDAFDISLVFAGLALLWGIVCSIFSLTDLNDPGIWKRLLFGLILVVVGGIWFIVRNKRIQNIRTENNARYSTYQKELGYIVKQNKRLEQEHYTAVRECDESCRVITEKAQPHIDETRSILSHLYSLDVVYSKYRNLPALTSIYEYLITGRCEELTGPHGAYNLYEDELRKDTVISQLNTVIENLEQIRQNQYMLYEQVCAIQQNAAAIRDELAQIKGYTIRIAELSALNAYYAARTERNTRILMYYHL